MSDDMLSNAEAPQELTAKEDPRLRIMLEEVTFRVGDKYITLTYEDFIKAGVEDSWVIRRIGRDEDLLTVALNKLLNS